MSQLYKISIILSTQRLLKGFLMVVKFLLSSKCHISAKGMKKEEKGKAKRSPPPR